MGEIMIMDERIQPGWATVSASYPLVDDAPSPPDEAAVIQILEPLSCNFAELDVWLLVKVKLE